eukprot:TRINITY_DN7349_c0_g2_i6.p1 TRINITY_DN7349_c0_g2~~TRINITY_DN7349_c0_g2_i6.p1  ORF type:complete len:244 (-),score=36.29 TRINITY_DN7349_c0_g2_i6:88-819(-)
MALQAPKNCFKKKFNFPVSIPSMPLSLEIDEKSSNLLEVDSSLYVDPMRVAIPDPSTYQLFVTYFTSEDPFSLTIHKNEKIRLGRNPTAEDGARPVKIHDPTNNVSRKHVEVWFDQAIKRWKIKDLNTGGGTSLKMDTNAPREFIEDEGIVLGVSMVARVKLIGSKNAVLEIEADAGTPYAQFNGHAVNINGSSGRHLQENPAIDIRGRIEVSNGKLTYTPEVPKQETETIALARLSLSLFQA